MKPLISIIICVYNNTKYLPRAVESVLKQKFENYEIIIIDDGSNDGTELLVDEYAKNTKIKVFHQENQWIYASFNNGIEKSNGDYFFILNSDDRLRDNALNIISDKIAMYSFPDVIWQKETINKYDIQTDSWTEKGKSISVKEKYFRNNKELAKAWGKLLDLGVFLNQANVYKKEAVKDIRFKNNWTGCDQIFNIDLAPYIETSVVIKETLYDFMEYSSDEMNTAGKRLYGYETDMFDYIYEGHKQLLKEWGENNQINSFKEYRVDRTRSILNMVKRNISLFNEKEIIDLLYKHIYSDVLIECIGGNRELREEIDSRVLSIMREWYINNTNSNNSIYIDLYKMLESLLRYEKTVEDFLAIDTGLNSEFNPFKIGKVFREKLET